jgi:hypothetical protein
LRFGAPITVNRGEYTEGTAALKRAVADMIDAFRRERNESAKPVGQAKA